MLFLSKIPNPRVKPDPNFRSLHAWKTVTHSKKGQTCLSDVEKISVNLSPNRGVSIPAGRIDLLRVGWSKTKDLYVDLNFEHCSL